MEFRLSYYGTFRTQYESLGFRTFAPRQPRRDDRGSVLCLQEILMKPAGVLDENGYLKDDARHRQWAFPVRKVLSGFPNVEDRSPHFVL